MMDCEYKKCCKNCDCFIAIFSIILGIAFGIAFFFGVVPVIDTFIDIVLSIATATIGFILLSLLIVSLLRCGRDSSIRCVASDAKGTLIGAIGAIVTTTAALTIGVATGAICNYSWKYYDICHIYYN